MARSLAALALLALALLTTGTVSARTAFADCSKLKKTGGCTGCRKLEGCVSWPAPVGPVGNGGCSAPLQGTDLFGGDLPTGATVEGAASYAACCAACTARLECGTFSYVPAQRRCFLKYATGFTSRPLAGVVSGVLTSRPAGGATLPAGATLPPAPTKPTPSPPAVPAPVPSPPRAVAPPVVPPVVPAPPTATPPTITPPANATIYRGEATSFSPAVPGNGKDFSCAYPWLSEWQSVYFAAINIGMWNAGRQCGRCAMARCVDPRCKVQNRWVKVYLVDQCPTCPGQDLDFSDPAFLELTGLTPDRVKIDWHFAPCGPQISGGIRLGPKETGVNEYWQAIFLHNAAEPIDRVLLNGTPLQLSTWGFWVHNNRFRNGQPHTLTMVSRGGRMVNATISSMWTPQDLGVQFPGGAQAVA